MAPELTKQFGKFDTMVQTGTVFLGLLFFITFIYLLVLLSLKLLGIVLFLGGMWMIFYLPWQADYQRASFVGSGRMIGLILIAAGILLLLYG